MDHASAAACVTGQFEQLVRAVCGLPLGATDVVRPAAIVNLLGEVWTRNGEPLFEKALAVPGVTLTLYGKNDPRPGRKMGRLTALGATPHEARARSLDALLTRIERDERGIRCRVVHDLSSRSSRGRNRHEDAKAECSRCSRTHGTSPPPYAREFHVARRRSQLGSRTTTAVRLSRGLERV